MTARILIAGGYTGGHIQCALAIAAGLREVVPDAALLFSGAHGGPEVAAVRAAGHDIETVWIRAIDRRRTLRGLVGNLALPLSVAVSRRQAALIVARFRPDVVVGVGAFPSAPVVAAAQRAGIPTLLHEANAQPGIANRFLGRRARRVCLGVPGAARWFPAGRTVVTGNPVRAGLGGVPVAEARARLGLDPTRTTLLVCGGSLGSPALNGWVLEHQHQLPAQVLWQSGRAHHAAAAAALRAPSVRLVAYLDDMDAAYAAADLVVSPAGALTLAELCALGKPAVIVPARHVSEDHQRANAGEGLLVCDDAHDLLPVVRSLLGDPARRRDLGDRMRARARPDATRLIVAEILALAR